MRTIPRAQRHDASVIEPQLFRRRRRKKHRVIPGQLRQGARTFLQPAVIGIAAVADIRIGFENDFESLRGGGRRRGIQTSLSTKPILSSGFRAGDDSVIQRFAPGGFEVERMRNAFPIIFHEDRARSAGVSSKSSTESTSLGGLAAIERLELPAE